MHPDSARLTFREMSLDDLDDMALLLGDPEVMTYYPRPKVRHRGRGRLARLRPDRGRRDPADRDHPPGQPAIPAGRGEDRPAPGEARRFAAATRRQLDGVGHFTPLGCPRDFAAAITAAVRSA
jgi:pimeloyl-ACP methyl ester carboxylesterase